MVKIFGCVACTWTVKEETSILPFCHASLPWLNVVESYSGLTQDKKKIEVVFYLFIGGQLELRC